MAMYEIPMKLYVEAKDTEKAEAVAELYAFFCTNRLRDKNGEWVEDTSTVLKPSGGAERVRNAPAVPYSKRILCKVFGEREAIRLLNYYS